MGQQVTRWTLHPQVEQANQCHQISELPHPARSEMPPKLEAGLVRMCCGKLSVLHLDAILEALQSDGIPTAANLDAINICADQRQRQHVLVDLLLQKEHHAQEAYCKVLVKSNPFLMQELDHHLPKKQVCS